jgi:riboflavin kinase
MKPVILKGQSTKFKGDGRRLGYPTANIKTDTQLADGVYFGFADLAAFVDHPALIFIGSPTTMGDLERRVEVHLLDIEDKDYYDVAVTVRVEYFHRSNKHFNSVPDLLAAMRSDDTKARDWFTKNS